MMENMKKMENMRKMKKMKKMKRTKEMKIKMKIFNDRKFDDDNCYQVLKVRHVKIVKEVKRSDSL